MSRVGKNLEFLKGWCTFFQKRLHTIFLTFVFFHKLRVGYSNSWLRSHFDRIEIGKFDPFNRDRNQNVMRSQCWFHRKFRSNECFPPLRILLLVRRGHTSPMNTPPSLKCGFWQWNQLPNAKMTQKHPYTLRRRLCPGPVTLAAKPRKMAGVCVHTNVHYLHIAHRLRYDGPMHHIPFHIPYIYTLFWGW